MIDVEAGRQGYRSNLVLPTFQRGLPFSMGPRTRSETVAEERVGTSCATVLGDAALVLDCGDGADVTVVCHVQ
jgi:hypothetical protein